MDALSVLPPCRCHHQGLGEVREVALEGWLLHSDRRSPSPLDELPRWTEIAARFQSSFLTVDVALLEDGSWRIVETGDGQVSGLPVGMAPARFYASLWNKSLDR